jgi:thiol-disulfide isomerase/thioredoxin
MPMSKTKLLPTFLAAALIFLGTAANAQTEAPAKTPTIQAKQMATVTFDLQKVYGMGPLGNTSSIIGSFDPLDDSERVKTYPKVKHKPVGLHDVMEFCYVLDDFQLCYQSYCSGLCSKDFLLKQADTQRWNLADTAYLSKAPIKCSISILTAYNNVNELVYIVDANQNGDFGDDVLRQVQTNTGNIYGDPNLAVPVLIEYRVGKQVKQENISILPVHDRWSKSEQDRVSFIFPEFRYARFNYKGQPYFVCTNAVSMGSPYVYIMPDIPNFDRASEGSKIGLGLYAHIGDKDFKFTGYKDNGSKVSLAVDDIHDFAQASIPEPKKAAKNKAAGDPNIVSNQLGFRAPLVKGNNINTAVKDVTLVSSADLKGKYIFVDFWSTYCGACIQEFPYLKKVYQKYDHSKFEMIGVLEERDESVTARLIAENNLVWPTIKMGVNSTLLKNYHVYSYPSSYLINPDGIIIAVNLRGEELDNKLKELLGKSK